MCQRYEPDLPCHDSECTTCRENRRLAPVCECGDWHSDHPAGGGRCRLCRSSRYPWDHCDGFRFSHWAETYQPAIH